MSHDVLTPAIDALASGRDLTEDQAAAVLSVMMAGEASDVQIAAVLISLRTKGETVHELAGLARAMRELATPVRPERTDLVDTAGTGGGRTTFNVSTTAAIIAAGAGCAVAKHGNRSATGLSGSADLLEALGARLDLGPDDVARCIDEVGFGFMFAPAHHAATRHVIPVRKELAVRTIFNFLGPLANPARPDAMAVGVADVRMAELVAGVYAARGNRGLVFHGTDGLDELTTTSPSRVWLISDGRVVETVLDPADLGIAAAQHADLVGGVADHNAQVVRDLLDGASGPVRDIVLLNAAAALLAFDGPDLDTDPAPKLAGGLERAAAAVDSGAAKDVLARWVTATAAS